MPGLLPIPVGVCVGGRQVTMDVLRVGFGAPTETRYALSFVLPEQVDGHTFNFSSLCWTGKVLSSPGCSTIFQSWTWEPQAAASGIHGSQLVVALP